jgi:expansin (peptidoglycan-binding protein)
VFALATRSDSHSELELALAVGPRIGVYSDPEIAAAAARIVRKLTASKDSNFGVVPIWLEAAFMTVLASKATGAEPTDVYVIDESPEKTSVVLAVTRHAFEVADWLAGGDGSMRSDHVGALADAFLEQRRPEAAATA